VTALARVNHDLARLRHGWIVAFLAGRIPVRNRLEIKRIVSKELPDPT
jgi:hypothetical protein